MELDVGQYTHRGLVGKIKGENRLQDAADEIDAKGGPSRFGIFGPWCSEVENIVSKHVGGVTRSEDYKPDPLFPDELPQIQYDGKSTLIVPVHPWCELTLLV